MSDNIIFTTASYKKHLEQILSLQQKNLKKNISVSEAIDQGFVTVEHNYELLKNMNRLTPHVIALDQDEVVGYSLCMSKVFRKGIPVLESMFEILDEISFNQQKLSETNYLVMGQVCIDKRYRGLGLFQGMYDKYFELYIPEFNSIITEVALSNLRSLNAHRKVGFEIIHQYIETNIQEWVVLRYGK